LLRTPSHLCFDSDYTKLGTSNSVRILYRAAYLLLSCPWDMMDDGENSEEKLLNSARSYKPSYQASEIQRDPARPYQDSLAVALKDLAIATLQQSGW
jgi:hypothetical protein